MNSSAVFSTWALGMKRITKSSWNSINSSPRERPEWSGIRTRGLQRSNQLRDHLTMPTLIKKCN